MHFLIAPDKFKDALSAPEAAGAIQEGIKAAISDATFTLLPMADGGEGTAAMLTRINRGDWKESIVSGPSGKAVKAGWGISMSEKEAYIELASASGLQLLSPHERNPSYTSTRGTGELIKAALEAGAKRIILGLGGSATNDGGTGMAEALGVRFLDRKGRLLKRINGSRLKDIHRIDTTYADILMKSTSIRAACDVQNPLLGPTGATYTFATQKGAKTEDLPLLEEGMENFAQVVQRDLGKSLSQLQGGGAAGGAGAGLYAFFNASLESGAELILQYGGFMKQLPLADWVITGEGCWDETSLQGKITGRICELATASGVKVLVLCGKSTFTRLSSHSEGSTEVLSISKAEKSLDSALRNTGKNLSRAAFQYFS